MRKPTKGWTVMAVMKKTKRTNDDWDKGVWVMFGSRDGIFHE
jgi:hypothetical protein